MRGVKCFKILPLLIGTGFIIAVWFNITNNITVLKTYQRTVGIVIDFDSHYSKSHTKLYAPIVAYEDSLGKVHRLTESVYSSPPAYVLNERVQVLYDPSNSKIAIINSFSSLWFSSLILGLFGVVFTSLGLFFWLVGKPKNLNKYKNEGKSLQALIVGIKKDTSLLVNGEHPYRIHAKWQDKIHFKTYRFVSEHIWCDPSDLVVGEIVTVYYLKNDLKNYVVDISHIQTLST